ncbi:MAG: phosphoenolpyruvate carboxykinase (ATP) [Candidatus Hydrothermae bacterium]|nr:phosphoenolpyruvate carboxykinase (ATP) [Candidatus Hydrothermae bacterium]
MAHFSEKMPWEDLKPYNVKYIENPTQEELREITLKHVPAALLSAYNNIDRITKRKARMQKNTYIIAPLSDAGLYSVKVMEPDRARKILDIQREYIEKQGELIEIDGYYGIGDKAVAIQCFYTKEGANVAGMQQVLAFPRERVEPPERLKEPFRPQFRLVMTPGLELPDMPDKMAIIVDLEHWTTYVMNSDYFGESKKGILRMFNEFVYQRGGLVLHAGAKVVKLGNERWAVAIMGLSGTGKTTTTFSKQGELTQPIQDDMIALWPDGSYSVTENGCFAKTFGLKPETEPVIYKGTIDPKAWVENVYMNEDGTYDFSKQVLTPEEVKRWREIFIVTGADPKNVDDYIAGRVKAEDVVNEYGVPEDGWDFVVWTQNGRSIIPLASIENVADLNDLPPLKFLGMLNRDEGKDAATPGIVRFTSPEQAAGYFMLGETSKTSAAGKERGKTRSPFTQPFFPRVHRLQAERFSELAAKNPGIINWLMNTGYVGGDARDEAEGKALKVKIRHSSAMLEHLFLGNIKWKLDPDFHYEIVDVDAPENAELLKKVPAEILNPRLFYEKAGRLDEYKEWVARMKKEREEFLRKHGVREEIIRAVVG